MLLSQLTKSIINRNTNTFKYVNELLSNYYNHYDVEDFKKNLRKINLNYDEGKKRNLILHDNDNLLIKLILWEKNSFAKRHLHPENCSFLLMEGQIIENKYHMLGEKLILNKCLVHKEGNIGNVSEGNYHSVTNDYNTSISLHVYF